jgi:uncharacterized protein
MPIPIPSEPFEQDTRRWLERAVIGLNLCPFAKSVHVKQQVHFVVSDAPDAITVRDVLQREIEELVATDPEQRDTTLLILSQAFGDFLDFNDFMDEADHLIEAMDLDGVIQIAHFHPDFQFAGTEVDDPGNATNRAPYPTLHLLREASIDRAVEAFPQAEAIFEANIATLERLGHAGWHALGVGATGSSSRDAEDAGLTDAQGGGSDARSSKDDA